MALMGNFNERPVNAGIMRDGESREAVSGPFAAPGEFVAGFRIWEAKDMEEALHWLRQCPIPPQRRTEIEIRPCVEPADFGDAQTSR